MFPLLLRFVLNRKDAAGSVPASVAGGRGDAGAEYSGRRSYHQFAVLHTSDQFVFVVCSLWTENFADNSGCVTGGEVGTFPAWGRGRSWLLIGSTKTTRPARMCARDRFRGAGSWGRGNMGDVIARALSATTMPRFTAAAFLLAKYQMQAWFRWLKFLIFSHTLTITLH
jgi:hypothetical protein